MSDIKLFSIAGGTAKQMKSSEAPIEKTLQDVMERNLETLLGVRFLATEYATGKLHGGRIDSLGIDENGCPAIIEYKRSTNENVINQGLFYLDWLMDHQAELKLLVIEKLGQEAGKSIEWSSPRLICIAGGFTKYDEYAVKQINRNIELIKYTWFENNFLSLDLVNATQATISLGGQGKPSSTEYKTFEQYLEQSDSRLKDLFDSVNNFCENLGDDVQVKNLKFYRAFKRIKNFACAEVRPNLGHVLLFLRINPEDFSLEEGFSRDVRKVGHLGTGDCEITIRNITDLKKAEPFIIAAYENS